MIGSIIMILLVPSLTFVLCLPLSAAFLATHVHRGRVGFLSNDDQGQENHASNFLSNDDQGRDNHAFEEFGVYVANLVQPSMALVIPRGVRNMTTRGSAFVLDGSEIDEITETVGSGKDCIYLLTAAHVAAPGMDIDLHFAQYEMDEVTIKGRVLGRNRTLDLALLMAVITNTHNNTDPGDNRQCPGLKLATGSPHTGTRTFSHGFPASRLRGPAMTSGIVCGIADGLGLPQDQADGMNKNNKTDETIYIVTDAAMSPGMSGGPLTDQYGRVLGINALIRPDLRALGNYAVSAEEIRHFLQHDCIKTQMETQSNKTNPDSTSVCNTRYRVLLFNDPMNKRERVSTILRQLAKLSKEKAHKVMMDAHKTGTGTVKEFKEQDQAESLCRALKQEDLLSEVDKSYSTSIAE